MASHLMYLIVVARTYCTYYCAEGKAGGKRDVELDENEEEGGAPMIALMDGGGPTWTW